MIHRPIVKLLALCLLLSSCASNVFIAKRHYTKGYYISHAKSAATPKEKEQVTEKNHAASAPVKKELILNAKRQQVITYKAVAPVQEKLSPAQPAKLYARSAKQAFSPNSAFASPTQNTAAKKKLVPKLSERLAGIKQASRQLSRSSEQKQSADPYGNWWGWGGGGGGFMLIILGTIVSFVVFFLFYLLIFAILDGILPLWILGFIVLALIVAAVAILIMVLLNSD